MRPLFIRRLLALLIIVRPVNILMTVGAIMLGFWLSGVEGELVSLLLLCGAGAAAAAYGNVINDIRDIATDSISHATRPLVTGELSVVSAVIYAILLCITALLSGFTAGPLAGAATIIPILLLSAYTLRFK